MAANASDAAIREMLKTLLEERFQMRAHRETKQMDGYVLGVAKGGARMTDEEVAAAKTFKDGTAAVHLPKAGLLEMVARRVTAGQIAEALDRALATPVENRTGLDGTYTFVVRWAAENSDAVADAPYLPQALQRELGLTIEKRKIAVESVIVDSISRTPTGN